MRGRRKCPSCGYGKCGFSTSGKYCPVCGWNAKGTHIAKVQAKMDKRVMSVDDGKVKKWLKSVITRPGWFMRAIKFRGNKDEDNESDGPMRDVR